MKFEQVVNLRPLGVTTMAPRPERLYYLPPAVDLARSAAVNTFRAFHGLGM
jgi:hypothetical protein